MDRFTGQPGRLRARPALAAACPVCGAPVQTAASGSGLIPPAGLPHPIVAASLLTRSLSPRERTVFHLLGLGYNNRSIARELNLSERTVKRHITVILAKLGLESRLQAGIAALISSTFALPGTGWPESRMDPAWVARETG